LEKQDYSMLHLFFFGRLLGTIGNQEEQESLI